MRVVANLAKSRLLTQPHFYFGLAFLVAVGAFLAVIFWQALQYRHRTSCSWRHRNALDDNSHPSVLAHQSEKVRWVTLVILAPMLVVSGLHMVQLMVFGFDRTLAIMLLKFAFLDICAMTSFVAFLVLAVIHIRRNDADAHARYMAGTVLFALEPALERVFVFYVPRVPGFASALYFALFTMEAILTALLFFEWRRRRVRLPFVMALFFFIAMHMLLTPVANSVAFANFAKWFARI